MISGEFRSRYTFKSLELYPHDLNVLWDYGESHHFKGPHDGIGGVLKRKVYNDVKSGKIVIHNAREFADYAIICTAIDVFYLDKINIEIIDVDAAIYIRGTLKGIVQEKYNFIIKYQSNITS